MKKLTLLSLILFVFGTVRLGAQNLYFCDNFTDAGEPMGTTNAKTFESKGGYVYLLYDNGKNIKNKVLLINVAIQKNNEYTPFDTKVFDNIDHSKTWAVYDYNFSQAGNFKVTILDGEKKELAKGFITVTLKEGKKKDHDFVNDNKKKDEDEEKDDEGDGFDKVNDGYYNAKMTFTTDIKDGKPVDDYSTFTITSSGGYIYIYVMNDKPLKSAGINLIISKMDEDTYKYDKEVTNEPYTINGKIPGTYIQYTFYEAGKYKVEVTNKDDIKIASGYVTIEMQED
jgi:hypothetical protein